MPRNPTVMYFVPALATFQKHEGAVVYDVLHVVTCRGVRRG